MTRFLFSFSFLLLSLVMGVRAQTIADFGYTKKTSTKEITITSCRIQPEELIIPSSGIIEGNEYIVTTISGCYVSKLNNNTKRIFVPSSVTKYIGHIIDTFYARDVKSIVLENSSFSFENTSAILVNASSSSDQKFDNIIVMGPCSVTCTQITNNQGLLYKAGEIVVLTKDNRTQIVQMYLYGTTDSNDHIYRDKLRFDDERLSDLLWAIEKHGIDLNDIESIDLSQMSLPGNTINFNLTDFSTIPNVQVITQKTTINDMAENYTPQAFTGLISYSRSNTAGWNTVCLPFDVKESDFPTGTEIYLMSSDTEDAIYLSRIEEGTKLLAGTPCFIWSPEDAKEWNLSINGEITANIPAGITTLNHWSLQGSFETRVLGTGYYKLNSAGDAFVMTTSSSHTFPFRCYIAPAPTNGSAPARLGMGIDEEATITLVPDDRAPQQVKLYDLMGRPRQGNAAGLFVPSKR